MSPDLHKELFMNKFLSIVIVLSVFVLLTAVTVSAQTAGRVVTADSALATSPILFPFQAAPAAVPTPMARPVGSPAARQAYTSPNGHAQLHQSRNARGRQSVSFQEYFGFDGIPFNGSHLRAFHRYHGRGF
jgi:hypothetical protein